MWKFNGLSLTAAALAAALFPVLAEARPAGGGGGHQVRGGARSSVQGEDRPSRFAAVATRFSRTVSVGKTCRPSGTKPMPQRAIAWERAFPVDQLARLNAPFVRLDVENDRIETDAWQGQRRVRFVVEGMAA